MARRIVVKVEDLQAESRQPGRPGLTRITVEKVAMAAERLESSRKSTGDVGAAGRVLTQARCSKTKRDFVVISEQREPGRWAAAGTMEESPGFAEGSAIPATAAKVDWSEYPGCPHCGDRGVVLHAEHEYRLSCLGAAYQDESGLHMLCPWCKATVHPQGTFEDLPGATDAGGKKSK